MRIHFVTLLAMSIVVAVARPAAAQTIEARNATVYNIEAIQAPAQEEGLLVELYAEEGKTVTKGEVLAKVDDTLVKLQRDVAQAELAVSEKRWKDDISIRYAKSAADVYRQKYYRLLEANKKVPGSTSLTDIELARLEWIQYTLQTEKSMSEQAIAGLEMNVSKAKMTAADTHILRSQIKAPWDGVVDRVVRFTGDWVKPGDPVLRMIRMDKLRVTCEIDARQYSRQDILGRPVTVRVALTQGVFETLQGTIVNCRPTIEDGNVFHAWTEVNNPKRDGHYILYPGMWAEMTIQAQRAVGSTQQAESSRQ